MKQMNKEFEYRGYKFNIKVELNTKVERRMNGEHWHTLTTSGVGWSDYYEQEIVRNDFLEMQVCDCERFAKKYVDNEKDGKKTINERLSALGFK